MPGTPLSRERTGVLCLREREILSIELEDPLTRKRYWSFPGGAIESGETAAEAAIRETLEETGYRVELTGEAFVNHYLFRWNGKVFDCTTHWYMAELVHPRPTAVNDASYLLGSAWLSWPRSRCLFQYNNGLVSALDHFLPGETEKTVS